MNIVGNNPLNVIFFDTETTGLTNNDEIVSISVIDGNGKVLLDTLVKPIHHISWKEASRINNIYPKDVIYSPTSEQLKPQLLEIFNNADLVIAYNINFDMRYIWNILHIVPNTECCMLHFAKLYGEYSYYWDDYKWQTLDTAMDYFNLKWKGHQHCSLSDTFACKDVWLSMYPDFFNDFM